MSTEPTTPSSPETSHLTRRQALQTLGAAATALASRNLLAQTAGGMVANPSLKPIPPTVEPFPLTDVRLLPGPFLDAQKRDEKYLLSLDPDRMLHNFRVNAGLQPKAPIYGGWESVETWADIRAHGHTLGHYLTACSLMFASTNDPEYKKRCDYIVTELAECQASGKTGLVNAFPDNTAQIDNLVAGRRVIGVPWYTLHKVFAGLRDTYLYCHNNQALTVLTKLSDWAIDTTKNMSDDAFQRMLRTEHGGMNEVLADVYTLTKDPKYLTLAQRFCHKQILDPLAQNKDALDTLHSNTQIPKIVGFQRLYTLTGNNDYGTAAKFFWKTVTDNRSFATGGNGDNEHFFNPAQFARHIPSAKTMETCCSHNMLRLTRALFALNPNASYADYYERTLYNTILASQDPDTGMMTYFQSTRPGYLKLYHTPIDSFWCCTGTGIENHAKYGDSIYFKTTTNDALYVNLFIPSTLTWKEKGVTIKQVTTFPQEGKTRLEITADQPVELTLNIRHPAWCDRMTVKINEPFTATSDTPGKFMALKRTFKTGDIVEITLPMKLHVEPLHGTTDLAAIMFGPIVLVGALGKQGLNPGDDIWQNERLIGTKFNEKIDIPSLPGPLSAIAAKIKPGDAPLTFKTTGRAEGNKDVEITLVPYYRIAHERYNMYWNIT